MQLNQFVKLLIQSQSSGNFSKIDGILQTDEALLVELLSKWKQLRILVDIRLEFGSSTHPHIWWETDPGFFKLSVSYQKIIELIPKGVNPNIKDSNQASALGIAVMYDNREGIKDLLTQGSDPNILDEDKETPLCLVMQQPPKDIFDIVQILLQHGANPNVKNIDGKTPLYIAKTEYMPEVAELLKNHGAKS